MTTRIPLHAASDLSRQARETRDIIRALSVLLAQMEAGSDVAARCAAVLLAGPLGPKAAAA